MLREALSSENWCWEETHTKAVKQMKDEIRKARSLALYDPSLQTVVTTDASDIGCDCGPYLSQLKSDWEEVVIAYTSKKFSKAGLNYSVVEKEALRCVYAIEKWHSFLWGRKFTLRTDSQALTSVSSLKGSNRVGRSIARWEARLIDYSFDIIHIRTEQNPVAARLSRMPVMDDHWEDDDTVEVPVISSAHTGTVSESDCARSLV